MASNDITTWEQLRARLDGLPRGTGRRLALAIPMNPSQFYRQLNNSRRPLSAVQAQVVARFFAEGEGADAAPAQTRRSLPVYGFPTGVDERISLDDAQVLESIQLPMGLALGPGEYFAVRQLGSAMEPRIFPGEILVVRRGFPAGKGRDCLVEFRDGSAAVKTYRGEHSGKVFTEQYNPARAADYDATAVKAVHAVAFKL